MYRQAATVVQMEESKLTSSRNVGDLTPRQPTTEGLDIWISHRSVPEDLHLAHDSASNVVPQIAHHGLNFWKFRHSVVPPIRGCTPVIPDSLRTQFGDLTP